MKFQQFIIVLILTQELLIQKYVVKAAHVDGEWGEWRPWTCSVTCGAGIAMRTRLCDNPAPANGGNNCTGLSSEKRFCSILPSCFLIDGEWGEWRPWTCSVTCGSGIDMRTRLCDNPAPADGGMDCTGPSSETRVCVLSPCPPVDGEWGEWRPWTCSVTCGTGIDMRTRLCDNPAPANGGMDCTGPSSETRVCVLSPCPPVDGEWGEWRPWTCSVTCGTGIDMRTRLCDNPAPANGGMDCTGPSSETRVCVLSPCPPVDGEWGEWRPWTCSVTCGTGIDMRTRLCDNPAPANGGMDCTGPSSETRVCVLRPCRCGGKHRRRH